MTSRTFSEPMIAKFADMSLGPDDLNEEFKETIIW